MKVTWADTNLIALGAIVATLPIMPARVAKAILDSEIRDVVASFPTVFSNSVEIVLSGFDLDQPSAGVGEVNALLCIVVR